MEGLGINAGLVLLQILSFLIVFVILRKWLFLPLANMLEKRRNTITQGQEDARLAAEARANAEKEAAKIISEAQGKAGQMIREATERAELASREVKAAAEAEAAKDRESALAELQEERNRMLSDLRGQIAALAISASQKLIGETLDEKRQHALLAEFFSGVKSGKVAVLEGAELAGTTAEVTSSLPLTFDEKTVIKEEILKKMDKHAEIAFTINPSILGGLIIRVGDRILDGSVTAQLESLYKSIK